MINNDSVYRCSRCGELVEKVDYPATIILLAYDSEGCERTEYYVCEKCRYYLEQEVKGAHID